MRAAFCLSIGLCLVGCNKVHSPSKSLAADVVHCKRSGVERSEPFETTWTGADGALRMRYRVGVGCTKPEDDVPVAATDLWQECVWVNESWTCGEWQRGAVEGGPAQEVPSSIYLKPTERGRAES